MAIPPSGRQTLWNVALLGLFLASGCSALIYEVVWFHQLSLVLGASAVSLAILLASFMGGMCLGNLGFGRWVSDRHDPLKVYAALELLIAVCGLSTLWLFPVVGRIYCHWSLGGPNDLILRSIVAIVLMLPPTAMMGATLPVIARSVPSTRAGMAWLGWFYGANTFGAMIGCLMAGMYLLRIHDVFVATFVAAAINLAAALAAVGLSRNGFSFFCFRIQDEIENAGEEVIEHTDGNVGVTELIGSAIGPFVQGKSVLQVAVRLSINVGKRRPLTLTLSPEIPGRGDEAAHPTCESVVVHIVAGLSGFTALGAEVIWTRYLGLLLGPTVYTFSIILAIFLFGLGLGSGLGAIIGRRIRSPQLALAVTQLLLLAAIPYAASMIVNVVPYWLVLRGSDELFTVRMTRDIVRVMVTLFPATCLWGVSFPLAIAALRGHRRNPGRLVGGLCAANTFGAIIGSLGVSLIAIPFGGQFVQRLLTLICGCSGLLMLCMMARRNRNRIQQSRDVRCIQPRLSGRRFPAQSNQRICRLLSGFGSLVAFVLLSVGCLFAVRGVPAIPNSLLADGRFANRWTDHANYVYVAEGLDSPIVVSDLEDGTRCFHVAGKIEASTRERDLRTQRLLGHLPAMAHSSPKKILVVGCGSGMTAGTFLLHSSVEEIVLCEMEKCVIEAARDNFSTYNYDVLRDKKTRIVCDDARHFLATTRESFDIITVDPIHPWVKGAAALYTAEFFLLCRSHLNQNGLVTLWVPLYESNEATVKCELATFLDQFPLAIIWNSQNREFGYDLVVVGSVDRESMDVRETMGKMGASLPLQISLAEIGITSVDSLTNCFAANGYDLKEWLHGAEINRDRNLRLQYLAGTNPDHAMEQYIFHQIVSASPGPAGLRVVDRK